jgi:hypothetical protein
MVDNAVSVAVRMADVSRPTKADEDPTQGVDQVTAWERLRISALEADLAYFRARLELIGEPKTFNQKAHTKAFGLLNQAVSTILNRLKRRAGEGS